MSDGFGVTIVALGSAIVGLATVAVVFSPKSNAPQLVGTGLQGFAQDISAATNPFSGSTSSVGSTQIGDLGGLIDNLGTAHL